MINEKIMPIHEQTLDKMEYVVRKMHTTTINNYVPPTEYVLNSAKKYASKGITIAAAVALIGTTPFISGCGNSKTHIPYDECGGRPKVRVRTTGNGTYLTCPGTTHRESPANMQKYKLRNSRRHKYIN